MYRIPTMQKAFGIKLYIRKIFQLSLWSQTKISNSFFKNLLPPGMTDHKSWVILCINLDTKLKERLTDYSHKWVFKIYIPSDHHIFNFYSDEGPDLFQT